MSNLSKVKLQDVATIQTGKLDSNAAVENGLYPFFTCDPKTLSIDTWAYVFTCFLYVFSVHIQMTSKKSLRIFPIMS